MSRAGKRAGKRTGIVLCGHGSLISRETSAVVWRCVDELRKRGAAHEITAAFWKELPTFHHVLSALDVDEVTIISVFAARGFFTKTVIPAEMGLEGAVTVRDGLTIRYAPALSDTPYLYENAATRVARVFPFPHDSRRYRTRLDRLAARMQRELSIAVIGHSTRREPESRESTERCVQVLRELHGWHEVIALYLDDDPPIREVWSRLPGETVVALPFFIAQGSHVTIDLQRELNAEKPSDRTLIMADPVGSGEGLPNALLKLAQMAGASLFPKDYDPDRDGYPTRGRDLFVEALQNGESLPPHPKSLPRKPTLKMLRIFREPGKGGRDFDPYMAHRMVEERYPGAVADWAAGRSGTFKTNTFEVTIGRQVGQFRALSGFSRDDQAQIVGKVCPTCYRHPSWFDGVTESIQDKTPCDEPCNAWLSTALKARSEAQTEGAPGTESDHAG